MILTRYIWIICLAVFSAHSFGQDTAVILEPLPQFDSLKLLYPFLKIDANRIQGESQSLQPFFDKVERIRNGSREQAVVVHLGDSHVQPGVITMPLREWLQSNFGNAGLGMIFPYRLAKSNGPAGYVSHCDTPWIYSRNASPKHILPTGIAGFTLWSANPSATFTVEFTTPLSGPGDTTLLTIFHANSDSSYFLSVSNDINGHAYPVADSTKPDHTTLLLDDQPQKIRIRAVKQKESQKSATLYGMTLGLLKPGVVVHTIGVNGAMFSSYSESEHFAGQLALLKPDLLILSLGTNEAFGVKGWSADSFSASIDSLVRQLLQAAPGASILFTTPPGIYQATRKRRHTSYKPNPLAKKAGEIISGYAVTHGMATWDWYTIMGGTDGMAKWKAKKLTDKRYIHFSGKGYGIQGVLFREAFIGAWKKSGYGTIK